MIKSRKYSKEVLQDAVNKSKTWADVCRFFGIKPATGAQSYIKRLAKEYKIETPHFIGRRFWKNKGRLSQRRDALSFCYYGSPITSHFLKLRLIRDGYKKYECEICKISKWRERDVVLELDHKDNDHLNNEYDNLQILCPNCHALETRERRMVLVMEKKRMLMAKEYSSNNECSCGGIKLRENKNCMKCRKQNNRAHTRKVVRPPLAQLLEDIKKLGFRGTGNKYSVSDNAIRKWIKQYSKVEVVL